VSTRRGEFEGRTTLRCRVPDDLLAEVDALAERLHRHPSEVMGDLVASVLPEALAEAVDTLLAGPARKRLVPALPSNATVSPELPTGDTSSRSQTSHDLDDIPSITAPGLSSTADHGAS
jgi:predicted transcriptional regulator